jgi:caffeoyl-CoA O-methyltransferase
LREAVAAEDWERHYAERSTMIHMRSEWAASAERCAQLQSVVASNQASSALEIGSFCGVAALALAEALPSDGVVLSVEQDSFVVEIAGRFHKKSLVGRKISTTIGKASGVLAELSEKALNGTLQPFDFVLVDADKEGMQEYVDVLLQSPNLLSDRAIMCIDMTPFKGQPPLRYVKFGFPYRWESSSGQTHIDALRKSIIEAPGLKSYEAGGLLIVQRTHG